MIQEEFGLEEYEHQEEFLRDWWSPKKAFYGSRRSGKTTVLLCELNRFLRNDMDCLWVSPKMGMAERAKTDYNTLFGKRPDIKIASYDTILDGKIRGTMYDAILMDEFQETALETYTDNIAPMNPMFVRASVCTSSLTNPNHYLNDEPGFFDSVYRE